MLDGGRVLIVDDHPFVRTGLRAALQEFWSGEVDEAGSVEDAYRQFLAGRPTLVITDISLPGANGIELVRRIKARNADSRIVVLSMFSDLKTVTRVMDAGADGFVDKASAGHCLEYAVRAIMAGERYVDPETSMVFATNTLSGEATLDSLSTREFQIFVALANAGSVKEVADTYHISVNTVGNHKRSIMRKLKLKSVTEMTLMAVKEGLIADQS
jgi:two-component system invasion response regulator UvrY